MVVGMKGAVVTNGFLPRGKHDEPAEMLIRAADAMDIGLTRLMNTDLTVPLGDGDALARSLGDVDFVVFWDKDVRLAADIELCGHRVFNPSDCIRMCDDKCLTHLALISAGVPTPRTVSCPMTFDNIGYGDLSFLEGAVDALGFPMVVKDCFGSFGQQVHLVHSMDELASLFTDARPRILQEYIECGATDIRVEVVGGRAVEAVERRGPPGDFRSNATIGGTMHRYVLTDEESELAVSAAEAVGADFAGVDIIRTSDGPVVCEVNSNAHIRNMLDCTGHDVSVDILEHIIRTVG